MFETDCEVCGEEISGIDTTVYQICQKCSKDKEVLPKYTYSLLNMCEMLHMNHTGTADNITKEEYKQAIHTIQDRIANWEESKNFYDIAVHSLCKSVIVDITG